MQLIKHIRWPLLLALLLTAHVPLLADEAADQYAVAAGHYSRQRWQWAAAEFDDFVEQFADHRLADQALYYLGESLTQLRRFEEAAGRFEQLLAIWPDHDRALKARFRAGEARYLAGQLEQGQTHLEQLRASSPTDPLLAYALPYLGEIALRQQQPEMAHARFAEGLRLFPQGAMQDACRLGMAQALAQEGKSEEAQRLYMALAAKRSSRLADEAQYRLAAHFLATRQLEEALDEFATLAEHYPQSPWLADARLGQAQAYYFLEQWDDARAILTESWSNSPLAADAAYWLGLLERAQGHHAQAAGIFSSAASRYNDHPRHAALIYNAGVSWHQAAQPEKAVHCFDRLLCEAPDDELADEALLAKMQCALALEQHQLVEQCATDFDERYCDSPLAADATRTLARSRLAQEKYAAARVLLTSLPCGNPTTAALTADQCENRYLLALALHGLGRSAEALDRLQPALAGNSPLLPQMQRLKGTLLVKLQRFDEALAPIEAGLSEHTTPDDLARGCAQLALCHTRQGNLDAARRQYAKLREVQAELDVLLPAIELLAETALEQQQYDWAAELFGDLVAYDASEESSIRGMLGLGWTRYRAGELPDAVDAFTQLIHSHADRPEAADAALVCGRALEQLGNDDAAAAMYLRAVVPSCPATAEQGLLEAARLHDRLEQHDHAAALYARLIEEYPESKQLDEALYRWAWTCRDQGQAEQAAELFTRLASECPTSSHRADALYRLAQADWDARKLPQCRQRLAELIASNPPDDLLAHAWYLQAQIAAAEEQWGGVTAPLLQLRARFPDSSLVPLADYWIAEAAYRADRFEEAGQLFGELLEKEPHLEESWLAGAWLRRAQVLVHRQQWAEAFDLAKTIRARYPDFAQQYEVDYVIGRCLSSQGRFDEARQAFRAVTKSSAGGKTETAAMAQWMIGESFFHQRHYEAAVREYLRLEILYAYPAWQAAALLQAGKCHELLGQWGPATEVYQRLVEDYPQTTYAQEAGRRLNMAIQRATEKRRR